MPKEVAMTDTKKNIDPFIAVALAKQKQVFLMAEYYKEGMKVIKKKRNRSLIKRLFGL